MKRKLSVSDNYARIIRDNIDRLYENLPKDLARALPADQKGDRFVFDAFGERCQIQPDGITMDKKNQTGVLGILISLYALHSRPEPCVMEPLKAFKDFPNSMPYVGAFATHTQQILVPEVERIKKAQKKIMEQLFGQEAPPIVGGDFSIVVHPLPKIALCYIFYESDDDFPASVTCLFSSNALSFLPIDALADVGEYTSKKILHIIGGA